MRNLAGSIIDGLLSSLLNKSVIRGRINTQWGIVRLRVNYYVIVLFLNHAVKKI